ncbi:MULTISPECIES: Xaa-Pro peptidase family protein [unclassified Ruegeria]|uniref:M24 family metallopeptidase n=1 Tax=unclassified Ruegeria TaxID=2625375 RepID=UPI001492BFB3|nr:MULTISPECIES: Xaa-Pro peptidase family protein [unclassified Ruegeria]NOD88030.1 M24 family metallopeptidase [Ruegeria sp. HKCCD4318]NOE14878.1 M24 family metallopeptidase [Ruegeria sp. HKCCD4318-2]NOG11519.1 aminopeptidase P family protein [Ruegeria sp. HKCCD4315]
MQNTVPQRPDTMVLDDNWSDLRQFRELPDIDLERLLEYRTGRIREQMKLQDVAALVIVNPLSMQYAANYDSYQLYQSRVPTTYLFMAQDGPTIVFGGYGNSRLIGREEPADFIAFFDAGPNLADNARRLADRLHGYLEEIGSDNRRVAIEYVNPSVTQACLQRGLEVVDGVTLTESARLIKSPDEIECIKWSVAVAELGMAKMKEALRPGVTETQLWGILNYTNLANQGGWHDGRMLCSGPRTNPWLQEATQRVIESGDLVGFDTDMVGPMGYFCDVSRTFHCGPAKPTARQKEIYQIAYDEVQHNMALLRPGITFHELQKQSFEIPEPFQKQAYPCIFHGVGMCDEYPKIIPYHSGLNPYDGEVEAGMVLTVESYVGAVGERDGVKLEEQVLITDNGFELLSSYPFEEELLD